MNFLFPQTQQAARTKIKRLKSNFSRTNSTKIDALKENKALYDMSWDNTSGSNNITGITITHSANPITTSSVIRPTSSTSLTTSIANSSTVTSKIHAKVSKKSQIRNQSIFGKKENTTTSKKLKVLCEASTSSTSFIKSQNIAKSSNDQQIQVPRKRIKVSSQMHHQIPLKSASDHENNYEDTVYKVYGKSTSNLSTSLSFFQTNSELSLITGIKSKSEGKLKSYTTSITHETQSPITDLNIPCCSLTLKRNPKLISSSASNKTQHNIAQTQSTSATTTTSANNSAIMKSLTKSKILRKSNSLPNLSKKVIIDGTKLKKKRILKKSETSGLKRKKTRVKKLWH